MRKFSILGKFPNDGSIFPASKKKTIKKLKTKQKLAEVPTIPTGPPGAHDGNPLWVESCSWTPYSAGSCSRTGVSLGIKCKFNPPPPHTHTHKHTHTHTRLRVSIADAARGLGRIMYVHLFLSISLCCSTSRLSEVRAGGRVFLQKTKSRNELHRYGTVRSFPRFSWCLRGATTWWRGTGVGKLRRTQFNWQVKKQ